ncbi:MAG: hypothetical protein CK604_03320 [Curvibacter sp. PD_MW3]|nr:MAG: hypothetical protein CK604_03320 [Curvibacter sp. PD_MW3]
MPRLLNFLYNARRARNVTLGMAAIVSATLLTGCSLWPKAGTSEPTPVAVPAEPAKAAALTAADGEKPATVAIPQSAAAPQPLPAKPEATSTALAEPAKAETPPASATQAPVKAAAPLPTLAAADLAHGYYINVGLFAVPGNGTNAHQTLEGAGLPVFSDRLMSKKGPLTRVRVGPFSTRAQADSAAKKIQTLKLDAIVFRH